MQLLENTMTSMEFCDNSKLDVSDVDLMEFLVGYNEGSQQQQPQYQEVSYSNNNSNTFPPSEVQQPPQVTKGWILCVSDL